MLNNITARHSIGHFEYGLSSLKNVGRTDDTRVMLYSVQCYALHWIDNHNSVYFVVLDKTCTTEILPPVHYTC